mgnify:CR=1 FL=1
MSAVFKLAVLADHARDQWHAAAPGFSECGGVGNTLALAECALGRSLATIIDPLVRASGLDGPALRERLARNAMVGGNRVMLVRSPGGDPQRVNANCT